MTEQGPLKPGLGRPGLVAQLSECVSEWERLLARPALARDQVLYGLVQRSQQLEAPSRGAGFGGVGHHLSELSRIAQASSDPAAARQQLGIVSELLSSARSSLTPEELSQAAAPASLAPPPLLSGYLHLGGVSGQPPATVPLPPGAPSPAPAAPGLAPPRLLTFSSDKPAAPTAPPLMSGAPHAPAQRPLPAPFGAPSLAPAPLAPAPAPVAPLAQAGGHAPVPVAPSRPGQPNLMVRSVLGLRAFGRDRGKTPAPKTPGLPSVPPAANESQGSLLGLARRSSVPPAAEPQSLGIGYGGLAPLPELSAGSRGPDLGELSGARARRDREEREPARSPTKLSMFERVRPRGGAPRRRVDSGESRWWIGALAALGICAVVLGIVMVVVMATRRRDEAAVAPSASGAPLGSANAGPLGSGVPALPRSKLLTENERFRSLLAQVHGHGGKESAELRALLDEQASIAAQALQPGCVGPQCKALAEVGKMVMANGKRHVKRRSHSPDTMRSRWLSGLEMPEIAVEDDPRVQKRFEFYTENPLGRETFQQMLFRCGAYKDAIQSALIRRGLPKDLIAVAYAESGCYPLAKSPVGAEGLWQFIPDAARAYHLRIIEGAVDERHSPQKSTDAAIQYFSDLYAKFGEWDLVFSAYNMGPFGLASRIEQVDGENVGFWELVDAELLPGETADYAPAIQAIALILNNLQRLKFGGIQQRAPQMTMDLEVPPNTRLSLVARAAALSLDELRRLNLDIQGFATPNVANFAVQVPKDSVWQARDTLQELLKSKDESDLCAPQNFDWGRQRFTPEMQAACARNLAARSPAPAGAQ